jgi:hypothetical protein
MTIVSDDIINPYYTQLYLEGPKPAYKISELTVEKMNDFVDNGNSLDLLIALSNSPVNEFEILNKILLDPACKYTNFATFLELLEFDLQYVNKLKSKLASINNVASNVSINGSIEQYPTINSITLYDNCSIQLVNSYFSWSFYVKNSIIFNRFINKTKNNASIKKDIKELLSTTTKASAEA